MIMLSSFADNFVTVNGISEKELSAPSLNDQFAYDAVETCKEYVLNKIGKVTSN